MSPVFDCRDQAELLPGMRQARQAIGRGELIVLPTDTVYGIAALATDEGGTDLPAAHVLSVDVAVVERPGGPELIATWVYAAELVDGSEVADLADAWRRCLEAITVHAAAPQAGGVTPSDLTLDSVTQDEIDDFEAEMADWEIS